MEEDHSKELLWGCIANKIEQIDKEESRIKWGELVNMVPKAFNEATKETEEVRLFFVWYQFFFRLYHRVKNMNSPEPFNKIAKTTYQVGHEEKYGYRIENYDYRMFVWGIEKSPYCSETMTNNWFIVPEDCLSPAEKKRFEEKI